MLGCLGREATVAVSVVDCVASVVDYEAHPMEDAEVMDVVGTQLAVATSRTRICIRITRVRTSRRVDTAVERMMEVLLEGTGGYESEPSQQIMVRNVSKFRVISDPVADLALRQLPWSTANEDLVELFETTGQVELAEILFDGTRSKGAGVVQFGQVAEAETAIGGFLSPHISFVSEMVGDTAKFQQYMYGGRPLDVRFNDRWHTFTPAAAKGGQAVPIQPDGM